MANELLKALERRRESNVPSVLLAFEQLSVSDVDLARALSVSQPMVSAWRHGTRPIPRARLTKLLAFLTFLRDRLAQDLPRRGGLILENVRRDLPLPPEDRERVRKWRDKRMLDELLQAEITPDLAPEVGEEAARMRKHVVSVKLEQRRGSEETAPRRQHRAKGGTRK